MRCTRLTLFQVKRLREVTTPANCGLEPPPAWAEAGGNARPQHPALRLFYRFRGRFRGRSRCPAGGSRNKREAAGGPAAGWLTSTIMAGSGSGTGLGMGAAQARQDTSGQPTLGDPSCRWTEQAKPHQSRLCRATPAAQGTQGNNRRPGNDRPSSSSKTTFSTTVRSTSSSRCYSLAFRTPFSSPSIQHLSAANRRPQTPCTALHLLRAPTETSEMESHPEGCGRLAARRLCQHGITTIVTKREM